MQSVPSLTCEEGWLQAVQWEEQLSAINLQVAFDFVLDRAERNGRFPPIINMKANFHLQDKER